MTGRHDFLTKRVDWPAPGAKSHRWAVSTSHGNCISATCAVPRPRLGYSAEPPGVPSERFEYSSVAWGVDTGARG